MLHLVNHFLCKLKVKRGIPPVVVVSVLLNSLFDLGAFVPFVKGRDGHQFRPNIHCLLPHLAVVVTTIPRLRVGSIPGTHGGVVVAWSHRRNEVLQVASLHGIPVGESASVHESLGGEIRVCSVKSTLY